MKIARDDRAVTLACSDASVRISEQALSFFSRKAADVISETYLTAMTGDHPDELAALDLSVIAVALTPS